MTKHNFICRNTLTKSAALRVEQPQNIYQTALHPQKVTVTSVQVLSPTKGTVNWERNRNIIHEFMMYRMEELDLEECAMLPHAVKQKLCATMFFPGV